jgi:glucose/arabinose dehydrogenase
MVSNLHREYPREDFAPKVALRPPDNPAILKKRIAMLSRSIRVHLRCARRGRLARRATLGGTAFVVFLGLFPGLVGCDALLGALGLANPVPSTTPSQITLQLIASGFTAPVGLVSPPDGTNRRFVVDQIGKVRIIDSTGTLLPTPFLDVSSKMVPLGIDFGGGIIFDERGLLSIAFHPNYATNGKFYIFYTAPKGNDLPADFNAESHVSEFKVSASDPNLADDSSERLLLRVGKPQFNHNGGQLAFGRDGFLYIGVGDGGNANDEGAGHNAAIGNGQDPATYLGKLLRIDVDSGNPYGTPTDNPFVANASFKPEIFALGLRNPWRFSFDKGGTGRLFLADVGQDLFEELNIITQGGNYGWRVREATHCFDALNPGTPPATCDASDANGSPFIDPILEYPHSPAAGEPGGIAVVGGFVYRGSAITELQGHYIFGDWSTDFITPNGSLFAATEKQDGTWTFKMLAINGQADGKLHKFIPAFGQDADGELYVCTSDNLGPTGTTGNVYKIIPAP